MQQNSQMQACLRLPGGIGEGLTEEVPFRLRLAARARVCRWKHGAEKDGIQSRENG